jgi:hypothetical protein
VAERMLQEVKLLPARTITNPRPIVTPQTIDKAVIKESKQGLSSNIKRPNDNTNNFSSNPSNLSSRPKKIQKTSTKVTK